MNKKTKKEVLSCVIRRAGWPEELRVLAPRAGGGGFESSPSKTLGINMAGLGNQVQASDAKG